MNRRDFLQCAAAAAGVLAAANGVARPVVVEDASPHIGCYGETAVDTPNLDALAAEGVRFESAFITCPVCSPARSAMATGMYQTTIGSHNHRSQNLGRKARGNTAYYDSYELPDAIPMVSGLFRAAGYYACNGAEPGADKPGKTDYNFINTTEPYDGADWRDVPEGMPFFAQIQLKGGKWRKESIENDDFDLPPYYPDDAVIRADWATYLASWERVDRQVGEIVQDLKDAGVYDNTLIAFITDHGISHARGKQYLYEEGIRIPMILRFPGGRHAGTVRTDLAIHLDLAPVSLACAGIPVPDHLHGRELFTPDHTPRPFVVSARDRCDETIDVIRAVRSPRYKYIRNFMSYRPHLQRNQYKDGKEIIQHLRMLHEKEALTPLQDTLFAPDRPPEELYDLDADPFETSNLAGDPGHQDVRAEHRAHLLQWMRETRDPGLVPEPILEDLGKEHGSKFAAMQQSGMDAVRERIVAVITAGDNNNRERLRAALDDPDPAVRYWAATWLGNLRDLPGRSLLQERAHDPVPTVQLAAHLALCKLGDTEAHLPGLVALVAHPNRIVGMYAMNAIEQTGILDARVKAAAETALDVPYEFTQRYGKRLRAKCEAVGVSGE